MRLYPTSRTLGALPLSPCRTVLLVDDDAMVRQALQAMIEYAGYTVLPAVDGQRAIEVARGVCFGMLITDFMVPDMDGFLLAERLTERQPRLPVLIISGAASEDLPLEEIVYRDWNYLPKPIDRLRLLETIEESFRYRNSRTLMH